MNNSDNTNSGFDSFNLSTEIMSSLEKVEFSNPTKIQSLSIPPILNNKDLLATAQTGTGKTAAFCLPMLEKLLKKEIHSSLILVPTREIGIQIKDFLKKLVIGQMELNIVLLIGGVSLKQQFKILQKKADIIIATPGRIIDHLERKTLFIKNTNYLVLDEADRMLDMGFTTQLNQILNHLPKQRQTLFFSATFQKNTQTLAKKYLIKPQRVQAGETAKPIDAVMQKNINTIALERPDILMDILNEREGSCLVFIKTKINVEKMYKFLKEHGFTVLRIHGDRTQRQRISALDEFQKGTNDILIATDVAARGLDIPQIKHVINYDPPQTSDDYVHRVGRTARAGATGQAINFIIPNNKEQWDLIYLGLQGKDVDYKESWKGRKKSSGRKSFGKKSSSKPGSKKKFYAKKKSKKKTSKKSPGRPGRKPKAKPARKRKR